MYMYIQHMIWGNLEWDFNESERKKTELYLMLYNCDCDPESFKV